MDQWKIGDKMEVNACEGNLKLQGRLEQMGMFIFFISDPRPDGIKKKTWRFRVSIPLQKVLWFDGSVDHSVTIRKLEL